MKIRTKGLQMCPTCMHQEFELSTQNVTSIYDLVGLECLHCGTTFKAILASLDFVEEINDEKRDKQFKGFKKIK